VVHLPSQWWSSVAQSGCSPLGGIACLKQGFKGFYIEFNDPFTFLQISQPNAHLAVQLAVIRV